MSSAQLHPCTVVDTSGFAKPLLLRSTSRPKGLICSACSHPVHSQLPVELLPDHLFTTNPDQLFKLARGLYSRLESKLYPCATHTSFGSLDTCPLVESSIGSWWKALFTPRDLTPFTHLWSTLLHFDTLFRRDATTVSNGSFERPTQANLCGLVSLCADGMPPQPSQGNTPNQIDRPYGGIGLHLPACTLHPTLGSVWAPCSTRFAAHLIVAWAKRCMEQDEARGVVKTTDSSVPVDASQVANLCRPSFGVLENWMDMIVLGKLGPMATNSVQIEPDLPSFTEEPGCTLGQQRGLTSCGAVEKVALKSDLPNFDENTEEESPVISIIIEQGAQVVSPEVDRQDDWLNLGHAWSQAVDKRRQDENTIVLQSSDLDRPQKLDEIVERVLKLCHYNGAHALSS